MICRKCQAQVGDDLIYCTNCGARLVDAAADNPTVLMTGTTAPPETTPITPVVSPAPLKWVALIVALVAIPASIFGVYLLVNQSNKAPAPNVSLAQTSPAASPNVNKPAADANAANSNSGGDWKNPPGAKTEVMNERIEIAPGEHYARPFEVTAKTAKFSGKLTVLSGAAVDMLIYTQNIFDEEFPDDADAPQNRRGVSHRSLRITKSDQIEQTMVTGSYVLVLFNNGETPIAVEGVFKIE